MGVVCARGCAGARRSKADWICFLSNEGNRKPVGSSDIVTGAGGGGRPWRPHLSNPGVQGRKHQMQTPGDYSPQAHSDGRKETEGPAGVHWRRASCCSLGGIVKPE